LTHSLPAHSARPETRIGKIMPRVLKGVAEGEDDFGDASTLADPSVVDGPENARSQS
jgi:acetyl-CoA synthetase